MTIELPNRPKALKGFAVMSPERRREVASLGGKSVPPDRRAFSRNNSLAVKAGRKGGNAANMGGGAKS